VRVEVSHPDKVLFPSIGATKGDLVGYYERVAEQMVPHVRDRPISMQRFPDGIDEPGFFHKDIPDYYPAWIRRVKVRKRGGELTHALISNADTLIYIANQNCITPHVWLSRADRIDRPDRLVFDLDPSHEDFTAVRAAARHLGDILDELGLSRFAMVTGSRGIHVWVPLRRDAPFEFVRTFSRDAAVLFERRHPDLVTTAQRKAKRGGRILIDVMRNNYAQTAVPPYAVRPRAQAPVATPIEWRELSDSRLRPDRWTIRNLFRRLARTGDPWAEISRHASSLRTPRKHLDRLLASEAPEAAARGGRRRRPS
jgi:bifunctional non-homologous end joining protein LigD